ncbi:Cytochrome P450 [Lachnellula hyalina]|uniref:Cytochrome P450 n=1 Tax=Lachnellula hyalina TaxID=1316788 RepID=A0A8H8QUK9_9HELO|nr:Cytochrome P450 [Lachnellula hyalina]TVY22401.1 Cytochrome P450 [Lachnellula hyalina]
MWISIALTLVAVVLALLCRLVPRLRHNKAKAEKTGLPVFWTPWPSYGLFTYLNLLLLPVASRIPFLSTLNWVRFLDRGLSWTSLREMEDKHGDTFMIVSPFNITIKTSNAELTSQVISRRTGFIKPTAGYKVVDMYGTSLLTTEGDAWKRHKKITGPAFSEKSNRLVFQESLRQTMGMINFWQTQENNNNKVFTVEKLAGDSATLSFNVICAAGFGIPQTWPRENETMITREAVPGFSNVLPGEGHTMTLGECLQRLLPGIIWLFLCPLWLLKYSPFKPMYKLYNCYEECGKYFDELVELGRKAIDQGENGGETMNLIGLMLEGSEKAPRNSKSSDSNNTQLSKSEITGNAFIFMFAGHETSANGIHYSLLLLAMYPHKQLRTQADIDRIVGDMPPSVWDYQIHMPRLYNSMVGAVLNEQLRLIPAIPNIPKRTVGDQKVQVDFREFTIPDNTFVHLNVVGSNRNPRYWPKVQSHLTGKDNDMGDFVPERWLPKDRVIDSEKKAKHEDTNGLKTTSFETSSSGSLVKPPNGAYIPFSLGHRACPGRRFAQVEITTVLSAILQKYTVELDVSEWADDEKLAQMNSEQKRKLYQKAVAKAEKVIHRSEQVITLKLKKGDKVPVRFVERGSERFAGIV